VLIASTSVATTAKNPDLINKVTLLQNGVFRDCCLTAGLQIYLKEARRGKREARRGVLSGCFWQERFLLYPGNPQRKQYNPADLRENKKKERSE